MGRAFSLCAAALMLTLALPVSAFAVETAAVCYPTLVTRSGDGTKLKKAYDLAPKEGPAGIPRSDFEQDGFRYTLTDLLKQNLLEHEERRHMEAVSLPNKNKDMVSVLALLPRECEFVTDDGLVGTLTLQLDTVRVEVAEYGSSAKEISATQSYPNLTGQDAQYISKTIEENGKTLTLKDIDWQTNDTAASNGYALEDCFTAVTTYIGSATSSYVKGYTVTADYIRTVSRIALGRTRYVAIFRGAPLQPVTISEDQLPAQFDRAAVLVPFGIMALVGAGIGTVVFIWHRREADDDGGEST